MGDDIEHRADRWLRRVRAHYEGHGPLFRAAWVIVAVLVVLAGLAMTVLPGPALVVIPTGLAMLAAAFGWARRLLRLGIDYGDRTVALLGRTPRPVKLAACAVVLAAAAMVAVWILR